MCMGVPPSYSQCWTNVHASVVVLSRPHKFSLLDVLEYIYLSCLSLSNTLSSLISHLSFLSYHPKTIKHNNNNIHHHHHLDRINITQTRRRKVAFAWKAKNPRRRRRRFWKILKVLTWKQLLEIVIIGG